MWNDIGGASPPLSLSLSTVSPGAWPVRLLSRGMHFYNCSKFRLQRHQVPPTAAVPVNSTPLQDRSPSKISGRPHHSLVRLNHADIFTSSRATASVNYNTRVVRLSESHLPLAIQPFSSSIRGLTAFVHAAPINAIERVSRHR